MLKNQDSWKNITGPSVLLRVENLLVLAAVLLVYGQQGFSWLAFGLFLLAPDLAMAGYLVNKQVGATVYNAIHTHGLPLIVGVGGLFFDVPLLVQAGLIWLAHIAMDRTLGYGLKYGDDFKHTHYDHL
jgi:hypothetical protein